jgi:hypothetical protein
MTKKTGAIADNYFIFKEINKNINIKEKKDPAGSFGGLH